MKGYRLLSGIREEFQVSYQTLDKHLSKLNIPKKTIDRRVYIKDCEYDMLYNSLSNSNRVKKIAEIDFKAFETESHKEELLKQQISFLEKRVRDLEGDICFKNKEIENFHGIVANSSLQIEGLERQVKLLEESKEIEIKEMETKLDTTIKEKNNLEYLLKEERTAKEILINENNTYKNMTLKDKLKFLFKK